MTRRDILRLTVAVPLALAVLFGVPGHSIGRGAPVDRAANVGSASLASPLPRISNGRIAFVDYPSGAGGPYLAAINPDGRGYEQLTPVCTITSCDIRAYAWSPDGRRLAFLRRRPG